MVGYDGLPYGPNACVAEATALLAAVVAGDGLVVVDGKAGASELDATLVLRSLSLFQLIHFIPGRLLILELRQPRAEKFVTHTAKRSTIVQCDRFVRIASTSLSLLEE